MIQPRTQKVLFSLIIAAAVLGIYMPGLHNALVFDDIRFKDTIFGSYGSLIEFKQRLLSYGSFVWVQQLFGEGWWKQRIFNLMLHGGVVVALYLLIRDLLLQTAFPDRVESEAHFNESRSAALLVGVALFAVNPMAVYAVGYLVQRSIVMATLFAVLACWFFVRGLLTNRVWWFVLAILSYLCAVLSKEHAVMTAAMSVPLYIYFKRPGWKTTALVVTASVALLGAVSAVFLLKYGSILGKLFDDPSILYAQQLEFAQPGITQRIYPLSILNEASLFFAYGFLWFVPNVLWMSIDLRPVFPTSFTSMPHLLGGVGYFVVFSTALFLFFKRKNFLGLLALLLFFPLLLFFTEFVTVWVQDPFVLYRSYLWAIAVPGIIAIALTGLKPKIIYGLGIILVLIFGALALDRNKSLRDEYTVWNDAAEKIDANAPDSAVGRHRPFLNLGVHYAEKGSYQLAYNNFATAHKFGAQKGTALFNMGTVLLKQKKPKEALAAFTEAESHGFTALTSLHFQKGELQQALGNPLEALKSYTIALEKSDGKNAIPSELERFKIVIRAKRAQLALNTRQYDIAMEDSIILLNAEPDSTRHQFSLGMAYTGKGKTAESIPIFDKLIAREPKPAFYYGRAMAHIQSGNKTAGIKDLDQAIALDPKNRNYPSIRAQVAAGKQAH